MHQIFFDSNNQLRSGWRFFLFLLSFLIISSPAQVFILFLFEQQENRKMFLVSVSSAVSSAISIILGWAYGKLFENLPLKALGILPTNHWLKDLIIGLFFGSATLSAALLISIVLGGVKLQENPNLEINSFLSITGLFGFFLIAAASEETLFRGYMFQTFCRSNLTWFGILSSSIIFAAAHNMNPSSSWLSFLNTFIAGIWLCMAYLKTRNLWFPLGLHVGWNWFQGCFFGINVSGISEFSTSSIFITTENGNDLISGGNYGIEGGLACTLSLIVSTVIIYASLKPANLESLDEKDEHLNLI